MPFYKRNGEELLVAPEFVSSPDFELTAADHANYTYPIDGWYWFENLDQALVGLRTSSNDSVTMRQARLALHASGLLANVSAVIAAMPEPARTEAQIEWEYASEILRDSPLVAALGAALGLDDAALDTLFAEAARL